MYRDAALRMPCSLSGVDHPQDQLEIVPGGFRCAACTYGKHRDPLSVVCNGCRVQLAPSAMTIVSFGTGYLCSACTERASVLAYERSQHGEEARRERRRQIRNRVVTTIAVATTMVLATLYLISP